MKYMGHKGRILKEIEHEIAPLVSESHAICDAFCGSAIVSWALAERFNRPVLAGDLQAFAVARARAILSRVNTLDDKELLSRWTIAANTLLDATVDFDAIPKSLLEFDKAKPDITRKAILRSRRYINRVLKPRLENSTSPWPITLAYGGYYFSIAQALMLDAMRATLPTRNGVSATGLAALIGAASKCSASPGHTAQPLGATLTAAPHVASAWNRSILDYVKIELEALAKRKARTEGCAIVASWDSLFDRLSPKDIAFCDPPYSDVQYSRFYHVLETLADGTPIVPAGTGRMPPEEARPRSSFSVKSQSAIALNQLLEGAAERELRLVITFPKSRQSNGLMAYDFVRKAKKLFPKVRVREVSSIFSSLGGNGKNGNRPARQQRVEQIITCSEK